MFSRQASLLIAAMILTFACAMPASGQCQRWEDGPLTAANPDANGQVLAMTVWDTDGAGPAEPSLVIGGTFTQVGGVSANRIAIWNGWHWSPLGLGCNGTVLTLGVFNNQLIAGGEFTVAGGTSASRIARWTGNAWLPLGSGAATSGSPLPQVWALTVFNGELIAGGTFNSMGGITANSIARWNGATWSGVGGGTILAGSMGRVRALAVFNSQLYAGGLFDHAGTITANNIARWNGSTWNDLGPLFGGDGTDGLVRCMLVHNSALYVGGSFTEVPISVGTLSAAGIARWTGSAWQSLAGGIPGSTIAAIVPQIFGIVVGGFFPGVFDSIARWQEGLNQWEPLDEGGIASGSVQSMVVFDHRYSSNGGDIIVGGAFVGAGGLAVSNIVRVDQLSLDYQLLAQPMIPDDFATLGTWLVVAGSGSQPTPTGVADNIYVWDGLEMSPLDGGLNGWMNSIVAKQGAAGSRELVVGGFFSTAGIPAVGANNIAKWSDAFVGGGWSAMGSGFNDVVWAVEYVPATSFFSEAYFAGGRFTAPGPGGGSTVLNRLAMWAGSPGSWSGLGTGFNNQVLAIKSYNVNQIARQVIAGGSFTTAGGVSANRIAMWSVPNLNGWTPMGNGFNESVLTIERHNGSTYVGGHFTASGATSINHVARWTGTTWEQVGEGLPVSAWDLHSSGGMLYASVISPVGQSGLMKWDGSSWSQVTGGVNNDPIHSVFGIGTFHNEIHISGYLSSTSNDPIRLVDWTRYLTTGVPWIVQQPLSHTVSCGGNTSVSITPATGYTSLTFDWRKDGVPLSDGPTGQGSTISGANTATITISNFQSDDQGQYDCVVASTCGIDTSHTASVMLNNGSICCHADINGDGMVNVSDLLIVINFWGPCPGGCDADIAPPGGDGSVNVSELLAVINGWGACP